ADEKISEIVTWTEGAQEGSNAVEELNQQVTDALQQLKSTYRSKDVVRKNAANLTAADATKNATFAERIKKQEERNQLPLIHTTTIGSLPQTQEVRQTRTKWRKGEISNQDYEQFVKDNINRWIGIQEELDLDVLVHGEFERNDMVEYFGEKFNGFTVTEYGWVQSYGSRCVK